MILVGSGEKISHYLYFWPTCCRLQFPSSGSVNLLAQHTELRKPFHQEVSDLLQKRYNSGTARWKRRRAQGVGKRTGIPMLSPSLSPSPQISKCSPIWKLTQTTFFFTLRKPPSLERQDWLNHQPLANNSSPSTFLPQEDEQWGGRIQLKV